MIGGNIASSNTKHFFPLSPLSFLLHCLLPPLLLAPFPVFTGLILDQPEALGILGHCLAMYFFISSLSFIS